MFNVKILTYQSDDYNKMLELRNNVLRKPLGLVFTESELKKDKESILIGVFLETNSQLLACCILTPLNMNKFQLRQMAVDNLWQGKGIGNKLIQFAEQYALKNNYHNIFLHARKNAIVFYQKNGYTIESKPFMEVGIPHVEMRKHL